MEMIIRNCRLRNLIELQDIGIEDGKIKTITPRLTSTSKVEIDAGGKLVSSPFVDPHLHLDAVLSAGNPRYNTSGTLLEGIQIWGERKKTLTKEIIKKNALKAIKWEIANGTLRIRTHADTTDPSLITVEALIELREEVKDLIDLQIVAFPQDGIFTSPDGAALMARALDMGADIVGGIPHNEFTREDGVADVLFAFEQAEKRGLQVDLHVDETGDEQSRFVEVMAKETINRGMSGRITASHTTAMHNYNNDYAFKLLGILKRAEMNMVTNPFDNSVLQNRTDGYPRRRGHTRVDEMLERGINVCIGHDSIMDPWYPMGKGSMLEGASLLMHTAHLSGREQVGQLFDMITLNSARTMNLSDYGLETGNTADLIILDAENESDAIRLKSECLYVIRKGKVIMETKPAERIFDPLSTAERIDFKLKD
ncbi:MAG: cytosine deaminase [Spirochaetales bacterium]|nr:cytosine deaminase [Spirochaetales bacterium]